jgi:hypothetical protein
VFVQCESLRRLLGMRRSAYITLLFAATATGCAHRAGTSGDDLTRAAAPSDYVVGRAFARARQGDLIATVDTSGVVRIRDADANRMVVSFRSPERKWRDYLAGPPITFNWDGTKLAIGTSDGTIRIWRVSDGRLLHTLRAPKLDMLPQQADGSLRRYTGDQPTTGVAFSPDDSLLASTSANGRGTLWRIRSGEAFAMLVGANGAGFEGAAPRVTIAFAPNGKAIAVGTPNTPIIVYAVPTAIQLPLGSQADPADLVFSPDADLLASADRNGAFVMWSLGLHDALWVNGTGDYNLPRSSRIDGVVAFSPEGDRVAGLDAHGTLCVWETHTGLELARYETSLSVAGLWFSADGRDVMAVDMVSGDSARFSAPPGRPIEAQLQALAEPRVVTPATEESRPVGNAIDAEIGRGHAGFKATVSRTGAVFTIPMPPGQTWRWSTGGVGRESVEYMWEVSFGLPDPRIRGVGCTIRGRRQASEQSGSVTTLVGECRPFTFFIDPECSGMACRIETAEPAMRASTYNGSVVLRLSKSEALRRLWSDHPDSVLLRAELRPPDTGYVEKVFVAYRH